VQVGDGIEGLVHISEMSTHHVDSPEQVVTPGEELWVKIIDLDLARRRISLSIKQAAEGGELAEEYRQHFEVDEHGTGRRRERRRRARGRMGRVLPRGRRGPRGEAPAAWPRRTQRRQACRRTRTTRAGERQLRHHGDA
jgi:small subunit ribosomal protein S1